MTISMGSDSNERPPTPLVRAAQYIRMSTEHQQYSLDNQTALNRIYAAQRGYEIVRTYADEGRSGLKFDGRPSLQRLLSDVSSGRAGYDAVLVYDVSRPLIHQDTGRTDQTLGDHAEHESLGSSKAFKAFVKIALS